jgi:hypothetical protein
MDYDRGLKADPVLRDIYLRWGTWPPLNTGGQPPATLEQNLAQASFDIGILLGYILRLLVERPGAPRV